MNQADFLVDQVGGLVFNQKLSKLSWTPAHLLPSHLVDDWVVLTKPGL